MPVTMMVVMPGLADAQSAPTWVVMPAPRGLWTLVSVVPPDVGASAPLGAEADGGEPTWEDAEWR